MTRDAWNHAAASVPDVSPPSEAWLFAQAILGKSVPSVSPSVAEARDKRKRLEWLATISPRHEIELRRLLAAEARAREDAERRAFVADIKGQMPPAELRAFVADITGMSEAEWDPSKHPRGGFPDNPGKFSQASGAGRSTPMNKLADAVLKRNSMVTQLTGVITPSMIHSSRVAQSMQMADELPADVASAAAAGLITGGKAVVNGVATAVKSVVTLGLSTSQLELIGVTNEDRARGYDTAVAISTGSGQVLIAVGTGGIASALSKGGCIARIASGATVVFDAAGNAVGVVQGIQDAAKNGVTVANGAQIAASALGLGANAATAKGFFRSRVPPKVAPSLFRVGKHGEMPSPRLGRNSHHGVMSEWMRTHYPSYNADKAPAVLMPELNHRATYGTYNKWRAEMTRALGGTFDWRKVKEADIRALSERMFDAAGVPADVRRQYWVEFERMKSALRR